MSMTRSSTRSLLPSDEPSTTGPQIGLIAAILLLAVLQRAPVAGLGAVLPDLHIAPLMTSTLTASPAICIAGAALAAPVIEARWGSRRVLTGCAAALAAALLARVIGGTAGLLVGSLVAYAAIAISGVLVPAYVRAAFDARRAGLLIAAWAAAISSGVALAGAITAPLAHFLTWQTALSLQAIPALLAWPLWACRRAPRSSSSTSETVPAFQVKSGRFHLKLRRNLRAWLLGIFFGLQSLLAVSLLSFEPALLRTAGISAATAGQLVALTMVVSVITTMTLGAATTRARHQTTGLLAMTASGGVGLGGLWLAPTGPLCWLWASLLGVGISVLGTALAMPSLRAADHSQAVRLGAFTQAIGYALAACGPAALSLTTPATGIIILLACTVLQLALVPLVGRAQTIRAC